MKAQRLVAAASLAVALVLSVPAANASGVDDPSNGPQTSISGLGDCLSQAVILGFEIVSSVL